MTHSRMGDYLCQINVTVQKVHLNSHTVEAQSTMESLFLSARKQLKALGLFSFQCITINCRISLRTFLE